MIGDLGPDTPVAALVRQARPRGAEVHVVPAGADKAQTLARFGEALRFPHWYGHNADHACAGRAADG